MSAQYNINVVTIGNVSSGKSTFINSWFLEELSTMSICRSTKIPQIYREIMNNKNRAVKEAKDINKEISDKINLIDLKSADPNYNIIDDLKPMEFYIHRPKEMKICKKNIYMSFYDLPGLNDRKFSSEYYNYVEENFKDYDIIFFIIDINRGFQEKDQIDLLNFICVQVAEFKSLNTPKYIIPIVNKSDNMTMEDNTLKCDVRFDEIYRDICSTLNSYSFQYGIESQISSPILYSAQEAFMYRMLNTNPDFELDDEQKKIIGINEMGRKYYTLSSEERIEKLRQIINDEQFIKTMIKMSGFNEMFNCVKSVLNESTQYNLCLRKILNNFEELKNQKINFSNAIEIFDLYDKYFNDIATLNIIFEKTDNPLNNTFIDDCLDNLINLVEPEDIDSIKLFKCCIDNIKQHKFANYLKSKLIDVSEDIKTKIYNYYIHYYNKKYQIDELVEILKILKSHNIYKLNDYSEKYLDGIIQQKVDFYCKFNVNYNDIMEYDEKYIRELNELKNSNVNLEIVQKIYKYIIKNKINYLIEMIKLNAKPDELANYAKIYYNLMLFYNFNSTKSIDFSEIYTLLLSNYIGLVTIAHFDTTNIDKNEQLYILDKEFIELA